MDLLMQLWLPILLSALAVWMSSAIGWMLVNHHARDHRALPDEERSLDALRALKLPPGTYLFPFAGSHSKAHQAEMKAKWERGPTGTLRIWGKVNMGACMAQSMIVYLVTSVLIGYIGAMAIPRGADFGHVFQVLGTAGVLAYCVGGVPGDIWFQQSRRAIAVGILDGIIFGLITGAIFAALWPALQLGGARL